ncbi:SecDF P1 head subdomain-containing protein [Microbacterium resistens]|uniref:SecDF P1 head subdomain-containing protein n=1 Tax=Microbacterium resistens TaxID=156977 RepID=UPI0022F12859|nr:hypothetical protein [Streptomyces sp. MS2A]
MRRSIRPAVLALVAVLGAVLGGTLAGCSAMTPEPSLSEVVLDVPAGNADAAREALEERLEAAGMERVSAAADGERVTVRFAPDTMGVAEDVFTAPGALAIRAVTAPAADPLPDCVDATPQEACQAETPDGELLRLGPSDVAGDAVDGVEARIEQGEWVVLLDLTDAGGAAMEALTGALACAEDQALPRMAVLLDGGVLTAPSLFLECGDALTTEIQFSGMKDRQDAMRTAALLAAELPEGVTIVSATP